MLFTEVRTMNISYLLYQAERTRSAAEQREIDAQAGEFAAAVAGLGRAGRRAVTRLAGTRHQGTGHQGMRRETERAGRPGKPATVPCGIPCP
jgi:hypothetical protein